MTAPASAHPYTLAALRDRLGLPDAMVRQLMRAGLVAPVRGRRNEYRFSFQDVVLLRTAVQLRAAQVPTRRLLPSLARLREQLPADLPISGLRITAAGNEVAVRNGEVHWEVQSGQLLLDLEVRPAPGGLHFLPRNATDAAEPDGAPPASAVVSPQAGQARPDADAWFARGEQAELAQDHRAAEAAYRAALLRDPAFASASLNLGALLGERGRHAQALAVYDAAIALTPDDALLHFNRAIALEDLQRLPEALASYDRSLALDAALADAHYNAARLCEQLGQERQAVRHYSAYRRLQRR